MMEKAGLVCLHTNKGHSVIYTGVTSHLVGRMLEHQQKIYPRSSTARYKTDKLVCFRLFGNIQEAIEEEKRIKADSRVAKIKLVQSLNCNWADLWHTTVSKW